MVKGIKVKGNRITKLIVPHKESELVFIYQSENSGTYKDVRSKISKSGLSMPTMEETASLVYAAFQNPSNEYSKEIINSIKNKWLWANNGILWVPEGVYIQDNPKVKKDNIVMKESDLIKKLEDSEDTSVRFVPYGFKLEKQSVLQLGKNSFVRALAGEEGAEKLAEIAGKYKNKPYLWGFNSVDKPKIRVVALDALASLGSNKKDYMLNLYSDDFVDHKGGYAFGIKSK